MPRKINWASPGYKIVTAQQGMGLCDICNKRINTGDFYIRGPRGLKAIHARCRPEVE